MVTVGSIKIHCQQGQSVVKNLKKLIENESSILFLEAIDEKTFNIEENLNVWYELFEKKQIYLLNCRELWVNFLKK
jgi:muramoyltetrapeptide carboxypeptidase LdcA involved in peptidoglycan recycling